MEREELLKKLFDASDVIICMGQAEPISEQQTEQICEEVRTEPIYSWVMED